MPSNYWIKCRVSEYHYRKIKQEAMDKGYPTISAFLRDMALYRGRLLDTRLRELTKEIRELKEHLKAPKSELFDEMKAIAQTKEEEVMLI
jgi:hypothetical protein